MNNDDAQIHVLEVIIVSGMLLTTLFFVKSFDFTPSTVASKENRLATIGDSILTSLESTPDPSGEYNSLLARYTNPNALPSDVSGFIDTVRNSLPYGSLFEISVINVSNIAISSTATIQSSTFTIYSPPAKAGTEAVASKVVVINGFVYELNLEIYYTLR